MMLVLKIYENNNEEKLKLMNLFWNKKDFFKKLKLQIYEDEKGNFCFDFMRFKLKR